MKTILVPTDFSKAAHHAINYAVEITKHTQAKLILLHVYAAQVIPGDMPVAMPIDEIEKECMHNLKKIQKNIRLKHNKLSVTYECRCGFPVEEINLFVKENKIDLVVMGMQGTGYLTEKILGSVTTSLMTKSNYAVLAIGSQVKFKSIKKIVLACDYDAIKNKSVLEPLKTFVDLFKSHVYILNVVTELETVPTISKTVAGIKLDHALENVSHSFHYTKNDDVIEGINHFVNEMEIDMVVMIPRAHTILHNLFNEPHTKRMAFNSKVPVLALHS